MTKNFYLSIVWLVQILFYIAYIKYGNYSLLFCYFVTGFFAIFFVSYKINVIYILFLLFFVFSLCGIVFKEESIGLYNFYNLLSGVFAFFSAYLLSQINKGYKVIKFLFLSYGIMVFSYILFFGIGNIDMYNNIFYRSSRNIVSAIFIALLCLLIAVYEKEAKKVPLIYYCLVLLASILLFGRSGIIISLLLVSYACLNIEKKHVRKTLFVCLFLFLLMFFFGGLSDFFFEKTNFSRGLNTPRTIMLREYLGDMNLGDILFGRDFFDCCSTIISYGINPHNSFISGHNKFGIIHTVLFTVLFFYVLSSKNNTYIFLVFILYLRYSVDSLGFFSPLDVVLFYVVINCKNNDRKVRCL